MTTTFRRRASLAVAGLATAAALTGVFSPRAVAIGNGPLPELPIPPPIRYGAIAVAPDSAAAKTRNHRTRASAESAALKKCGVTGCTVLSSFTQCGAVAHDGITLQGGTGPTRAAAEDDALTRLGGGRIITWACN
ncbi:hypothetical protein AO501_29025 [Mycobacterium gordonae]|uniref:DUF4189 domain-containing protein n=1 Tax=Mycobacterium gordonae TaxID=1778 RepID=A0A0Q2LJ61_MYCGO|nr:DUF4189 domain-containing protein [Mycobacterium gordonae]KQH76273.1 hypothetical protein AO501_29025 [Mycobacterium gordonae]